MKNLCRNCVSSASEMLIESTTILSIRRKNKLVIIGDGQATLGSMRLFTDAKKVFRLTDKVICGFAGNAGDCITLKELMEQELENNKFDLMRACINFSKKQRIEKGKHLNSAFLIGDPTYLIRLDGSGNFTEIKDGILGIGSGGAYAQCAAKALYDVDRLTTEEIAHRAMNVAADLCVHTNKNFVVETLEYI